jgi:hypothetical protein
MDGYVSYAEIHSVMADRLPHVKRERIVLNLGRRSWVRDLARVVLTFLF